MSTLNKVMGLVAFRTDRRTANENYRVILLKMIILQYYADERRWEELEELFVKESYSLFSQPQTPIINQSLQTGISVLKTDFCTSDATFNE